MAEGPFDLRRFAPPAETTFTLTRGGDHVYAVRGDVEVDDVATMLRIENVVTGREDGDAAEAFSEGKQVLLRLVQECQPEITSLKVGAQELLIVFALIVHGTSVAEAVMESITASNAEPGVDPAEGGQEGSEAAATPLRSPKPSSEPSSLSDTQEAGLPATGTG